MHALSPARDGFLHLWQSLPRPSIHPTTFFLPVVVLSVGHIVSLLNHGSDGVVVLGKEISLRMRGRKLGAIFGRRLIGREEAPSAAAGHSSLISASPFRHD